jgi:hypothetical protein
MLKFSIAGKPLLGIATGRHPLHGPAQLANVITPTLQQHYSSFYKLKHGPQKKKKCDFTAMK